MRHVLAVLAGVIALAGASAQAEIRLGVLYPIAGTGAVYGVPAMFGHDLAVDEINAAGGVPGQPLATFKRDTKLKPAAATAKELITKDGRRVSAAPPMGSVQVERIRSPLCRSIVPCLLGPPTRCGFGFLAVSTSL